MSTTNRTKATSKRLDAAVAAFHARYASFDQYGPQRWHEDLVPALLQPTSHAALVNGFVNADMVMQLFTHAGIDDEELKRLPVPLVSTPELSHIDNVQDRFDSSRLVCFERLATATLHQPFPVPSRLLAAVPGPDGQKLLSHWNMDPSSILAASLLKVAPGDRVLDLCSAPGGKSIVLAQYLFPHMSSNFTSFTLPQISPDDAARSSLHCNEVDLQRNKRLEANLHAYLPVKLFESKAIKVLQLDGSSKTAVASLPYGATGYDKVLIDAPCSSERHILHAYTKATQAGHVAGEMMNWKPSHSLTLAKTQVGLLTNGLLALRMSGRVVYATCALSKEENDLVIETVLRNIKKERKREKLAGKGSRWDWELEFTMGESGIGVDVGIPLLEEKTEPTKYGRIALPDKGGWGPLYFCVMHKTERKKRSKKPGGSEVVAAGDASIPTDTDMSISQSTLSEKDKGK